MGIPVHPFAEIFPMLTAADAAALREDIETNGLRERIVVLDGQILDGRNRHAAAVAAGLLSGDLPPEGDDLWVSHFRRFNPAQDGDPLAWVLSKNLHRRHLSESQRAMVAADLARLGRGRKADSESKPANLPVLASQPEAAELLHVSERSVRSAVKVRDAGAPELVEKVRSGEVAVSAAADIASLPVTQQLAILQNRNPQEFRRAVRELRADRAGAGRAVSNSRVAPPDDLDYAPTPPWATRALLRLVMPHLGHSLAGLTVLEPACGEGHISGVLEEAGAQAVWASDIWDYSVDGVSPPGWIGVRDYLAGEPSGDGIDWVITNPPFRKLAEMFAHRALAEAQVGVALFVRLGWLASNGRYDRLYSVNPPTLVAIFAEDVPLHMGRWEPDGETLSDYVWLVWIKGAAPRAPFWIPPGQRASLTMADDIERFTAHPVRSVAARNAQTHQASEAIAISKPEALEIIRARYIGSNGQALADELRRPLNTIRKWAWEAGVSERARNLAQIEAVNAKRKGEVA